MRLRSKAREVALHLLYQIELSKQGYQEAFQNYLHYNPQTEEVVDFASVLIKEVAERTAILDALIKKYVKNWEIERMAFIDRNILRIAVVELLFLDDIPPKVSINEAIELAKKFGDIDSPRFVNGILDKIYKMEKEKAANEKQNESKV